MKSEHFDCQPFYLNGEQVQWLKNLLRHLSVDEKIAQLIFWQPQDTDISNLNAMIANLPIGGLIQHRNSKKQLYEENRFLQTTSAIPLLIAAQCDSGTSELIEEGTFVGSPAKIASTGDDTLAYQLGHISGIEASAVGINCVLGPSLDIPLNRDNPNLSSQMWGDEAESISDFAACYMSGVGAADILPILLHFPGDGTDWRDVYQTSSPNQCSLADWKASFGRCYRHLIREDVPVIMVGGNAFPSYIRTVLTEAEPRDVYLPANMSHLITTKLLRETLGFNGLIVSDNINKPLYSEINPVASVAVDMLNAGCNMIVTSGEPMELFNEIKQGLKNKTLDMKVINRSVGYILAAKTMLGLDEGIPFLTVCDKKTQMEKIHQPNHQLVKGEIADKGITLLKDRRHLLPLNPEMAGKIYLVPLCEKYDRYTAEHLAHLLHEEQFTAEVLAGNSDAEIESIAKSEDIVIYLTTVRHKITHYQRNNQSVIPGRFRKLHTMFISFSYPFYLREMPQIGTYINCYDHEDETLMALVAKLIGDSQFVGHAPFKVRKADEIALY